jgi:hypothetical protein
MKKQEEITKQYESEVSIGDDVYYVHYQATWHCYMDGIGAYEYHGSKEYDQGKFCADLLDVEITKVYDFDGNEIQPSDELRKEIEDIVVKFAEL